MNADAPMSPIPRRAWLIVALLLMLQMVVQGIISAGISIFDARIIADLGIGRGALKFRDFVQIMSSGIAGIVIGYLALRISPATLAKVGLALLAVCLFLYSKIASVWSIYAIHMLMGFSYSASHVVIVVLIVRQWFPRRQPIAIGMTLAGASLGMGLFPQIIVRLLQTMEWRDAMLMLAVVPLLYLPILALLLKENPAASAGGPAPVKAASAGTGSGLSLRARFTWLALAAFGIFYSGPAFIMHTFLNLKDQNFDEQAAATGVTLIFLTGLLGKFFSGFLAEKWQTSRVWMVHQFLMLFGAIALTYFGTGFVWFGLACLGFGWGGCFALAQVMVAEQFSGAMLGRLTGWFIAFEGVGAGSGSWLTGVMFDRFQSYAVPFNVCIFLIVVSVVATIVLGRGGAERAS